MAIKNEFPSPYLTELTLKDILKELGIAPIVLEHWKISIEANPVRWSYEINLEWRTYRIRKFIDKDELALRNIDALRQAARFIARDLCKYNAAEDEEHMEALVLLSMRPTNEPQNQQL